jgi:hypothetical protein
VGVQESAMAASKKLHRKPACRARTRRRNGDFLWGAVRSLLPA